VSPAGYSGTPLPKKLGIKEGCTVAVIGDPGHADALLQPLPDRVTVRRSLRGPADVVVLFARSVPDVARRHEAAAKAIFPAGGLWVCWPKRTSPLATGVTEQDWRDLLLPTGLVDNKVCAVDEDWSGLRFVHRKDRRA
jgi:hypothetical protein